jgi:O-6-methylguanine DNA methyltransferase
MNTLTVKNAKGLNVRKELPKTIGSFIIHEAKAEIDKLLHDFPTKDVFVLFNEATVFLTGFKLQTFSKDCFDIYIWEIGSEDIKNINSENIFVEKSKNTNEIKNVISFVLYESFQIRNSHKISIYPCTYQIDWIHEIQKAGFKKEGYVKDRLFNDDKYYDSFIYSMMSDEFSKFSTGYIKILNTTLKVRTTEYAVFEISVTCDSDVIFSKSISDNAGINFDDKANNVNRTDIAYDNLAYVNLKNIINQLAEYDAGTRKTFEFNPEFYDATDFQKKTWKACESILYGQTTSYEALASKLFENDKMTKEEIEISSKNFSRAVGVALSKNPIMIMIPCHRIIGKDGKLVGFAGGIELKDSLLTKEMMFFK